MKKIGLLLMVTVLFISLLSGICLAGESKAIVIQQGEKQEVLAERAIVGEQDVLLPVAVIKREVFSQVELNRENKTLEARFSRARFRVEDNETNKTLLRSTVVEIPYQTINGSSYVSAAIAAKVFGFVAEVSEDKFVLAVNRYSSFDPLVLPRRDAAPPTGKVVLSWQPTFEEQVDLSKTAKVDGLNVVSPSWLAIVDERGTISHKIDYRYVKEAKAKGYQVWPLITNSFDPALTHEILSDVESRQNVVKQLAMYASLYELDGINLDFENIYDKDRELLNVFVKEIADSLKRLNVIVSIDVTIPSEVSQWSMCYDRKTLAETVDYVMLMAYDEHWRTSPISGSVASLVWVERGLVKTLQDVPAQKLVLGVPFYMREWQEDMAGGNVKAKTMTMAQAEQVIADKGIVPIWLDDCGQYYFEYQKENDDKRYRVWQEDVKSLAMKADLVKKYNLAGIAGWRRGFENPEIWPMLAEKMHQPVVEEPHDKKKEASKKHSKH